MSHHYSGPDLSFPQGDPRIDLADFYIFPKPGDSSKTTVVIDAHPSAGVNPTGPTTREPFAPEAIYELKIDTDNDLVANIAYRFRFATVADGMTATVYRVEGADAAGTSETGEVIFAGAPVSTSMAARVVEAGDYRFFAGWRSDPNFFDAGGAIDGFKYTGADFFADKNVCAIILEIPNSALGSGDAIGVWDRVVIPLDDGSGGWRQVERGSHALQSVFFCPGDERAEYLAGAPDSDGRFVDSFAHTLEHSGGYSPEEARRLASVFFLPDILPFHPGQPARYPGNGRSLLDHATDTFVEMFTNGKAGTDNVKPHNDMLAEFPYLGEPHTL